MVQRPAQKGFHLLVEPLANAARLRFGDATGAAQGLHQGINLPGGNAAGVGLHHHDVKSPVDPAAWLEPVGKEATLTQFWDRQADVAYLGGE
jgi:hypothetical protein